MKNSRDIIKKVENSDKYSAAFTAASILLREHQNMEQILTAENFDELIEEEVKKNEFLGIRTEASRKRVAQEIRKRFEYAPLDFWQKLFSWEEKEQRLALFFLCLKTYPLVLDFHIEVALQKWKSKSYELDTFDLQMRLDEIASIDEEVMGWTKKTQKKTITVYKRMISEAGLLKDDELTKPQNIHSDFWNYFVEQGESWFIEACFYNKNQI